MSIFIYTKCACLFLSKMTNEIENMVDTTSKSGAMNIASSSRTSVTPAIASAENLKNSLPLILRGGSKRCYFI